MTIDRSGAPGITPDSVDTPYPGKTCRVLNTGTAPDSLETMDQDGNPRYIAILTTAGLTEFRVASTPPAGVIEPSPIVLRGEDGYLYDVRTQTFPDGSSTIETTNISTVVQGFNLIEMATGITWTFFVNLAGSLELFRASDPFPPGTPFVRISPVITPHYLALLDEVGGTQYVRVLTLGGTTQFNVSTTQPAGIAYAAELIEMRGVSLSLYHITARSQSVLQVTEV
jgi:hypothetical protein